MNQTLCVSEILDYFERLEFNVEVKVIYLLPESSDQNQNQDPTNSDLDPDFQPQAKTVNINSKLVKVPVKISNFRLPEPFIWSKTKMSMTKTSLNDQDKSLMPTTATPTNQSNKTLKLPAVKTYFKRLFLALTVVLILIIFKFRRNLRCILK